MTPTEDDPTIHSEDAHTIDVHPRKLTPATRDPERIGRYRILGRLGKGGMGIVFEAEQEQPRRRVALKVIRGGSFVDEMQVRLFQREVDSLARLEHPNIAAIYEAGRTEHGEHFFSMELVRGKRLDEALPPGRQPLDAAEIRLRLRIFLVLARAVAYAHQRGVIHRDLKPSNIFLAEEETESLSATSGGLPTLKILDFGLARITEADAEPLTVLSEVGEIKGTLPYMSPEQARGDTDQIDLRTDVYALGVILYELLTGRRPYDLRATSIIESVRIICEEPPAPLHDSWSGGRRPDADLQTIVGKALEKEADRRYASAAAMADDVERYLESRPILARAPSTMDQLGKFARRNRALVAGVAATMVALLAGIVATTTFGLREQSQRRAAEQARRDTEDMVEFQQGMLGEIDARQMGHLLEIDLGERLAQARREAGADSGAVKASLASFEKQMASINTTDAALRVIDENILAKAITATRTQFADRPLIRAQLLRSIGETYYKLGLLEQSEKSLLASSALFDSLGASETAPALRGARALGDLYLGVGDVAKADSLYGKTFETQRRVLGPDNPETIQTLGDLALLRSDQEQYAASESLYALTVAALHRIPNPDERGTLTLMSNYAWTLCQDQKYAQSESLSVETLRRRRELLGNEHSDTQTSVNNLGVLYMRTNRPELAEPLYIEGLETSRRLLGDEHPEVLVSITNLGTHYNRQKKFAEAEAILAKSLATTRKVLPHEFVGTGITLLAHSEALIGLGRDKEAEPELLEAYGILHALGGDDDPGVKRASAALAGIYERTGRSAEAAKWGARG